MVLYGWQRQTPRLKLRPSFPKVDGFEGGLSVLDSAITHDKTRLLRVDDVLQDVRHEGLGVTQVLPHFPLLTVQT